MERIHPFILTLHGSSTGLGPVMRNVAPLFLRGKNRQLNFKINHKSYTSNSRPVAIAKKKSLKLNFILCVKCYKAASVYSIYTHINKCPCRKLVVNEL